MTLQQCSSTLLLCQCQQQCKETAIIHGNGNTTLLALPNFQRLRQGQGQSNDFITTATNTMTSALQWTGSTATPTLPDFQKPEQLLMMYPPRNADTTTQEKLNISAFMPDKEVMTGKPLFTT